MIRLLCAALLSTFAVTAFGATQDCPVPQAVQDQIQTAIDNMRTADNIYGITYAVYTDSCFLLSGKSGTSTKTGGAISPDTTIYRMGSISKMFTDLSIAQLMEAGILTADTKFMDLKNAPIVQYLWDHETPARIQQWSQITIGDFIGHQSGISKDLPGSMIFMNTESLKYNAYPSVQELFQGITQVEFLYTPGKVESGIKYSNLGVNLLARIVEAYNPEGLSFADYVTKHVANPLGMQSLYYEVPLSKRADMVQGYGVLLKDGTRTEVPKAYFPGAYDGSVGVATTAKDISLLGMEFLKLMKNQGTVVTDPTITNFFFTMRSQVSPVQGWGNGPEWEVLPNQTANDPLWVGHTGTGASERLIMMVSPEMGYGVAILFNVWDANREKYVQLITNAMPKMNVTLTPVEQQRIQAARAFLLATPTPVIGTPIKSADPAVLQKYVGNYFADIIGPYVFSVSSDGFLQIGTQKLETVDAAAGKFRFPPYPGSNGINTNKEPVTFEFDAQGNVTQARFLQIGVLKKVN